ncbi:MAG TPA: alpha-hydroxyketone-type quorum-sensing autoinducer synthase [Burkholderiales bacterium]|nr:alpha-hydroxyketone-type quorum-sensing autoinducer synthase [Burkholderiales bacterium]
MSSLAVAPTGIPPYPPPPELPEFLAARVERYYRERVRDTWGGRHILHGRTPGADALHLSSNDYLAVARHPRILRAMAGTLERDGNGLLMSGIFLHGDSPQLEFENNLAHFMHAQAGVLCQSGYVANTGLIQSIANDQVPVYADMLAHMSLWEGIRSAGAQGVMFYHNDPEHLERQILRHGPGVILVDTVYSTNGSLCPLKEIAEIAAVRGCVLVADESHSLGTHGPNGEGLVVELGLESRVHFRTASLAKAFAARAGFIACAPQFSEYFKFEALPAIFSSTLLPHEVAGLSATLDVIRDEGWRRDALRANGAYVREGLDNLGYNLNGSNSQIISLESGTEPQTILLRDALEKRGIFGSVFCAPATPKNRAMVRLSLHSALSRDDMDRLLAACAEVRAETGFDQWPSTRRRRNEERVGTAREAALV